MLLQFLSGEWITRKYHLEAIFIHCPYEKYKSIFTKRKLFPSIIAMYFVSEHYGIPGNSLNPIWHLMLITIDGTTNDWASHMVLSIMIHFTNPSGLSPSCYVGYKFKKMVGSNEFRDQFRKINELNTAINYNVCRDKNGFCPMSFGRICRALAQLFAFIWVSPYRENDKRQWCCNGLLWTWE